MSGGPNPGTEWARSKARTRAPGEARGPAERYVRDYTLARQSRTDGWNELEQALVMTLVDWKCDAEMRPSSGPGSDCSDLMDTALGRLLGLVSGDLTPEQILESIDP